MAGAELGLAALSTGVFSAALAASTPWWPTDRAPPPHHVAPTAPHQPLTLLSLQPQTTAASAQLWNAANPELAVGAAATPFVLASDRVADRVRAVNCLTAAIYYEAGHESSGGQRAVAQVVLNRLRHPAYPKTVCGVVFEGSTRSTGCQFTFTCDGSLARAPTAAGWRRAQGVALAALEGQVDPEVGYATHYHADYVAPYWSPSLQKVATIGAHIFYRQPGGAGQAGTFAGRYLGGESDEGLRPAALDTAAFALEAAAVEPATPAPEPHQIVSEVADITVAKLDETLKAAPNSVPAKALKQPPVQDEGRTRLAMPRDSF